MRSLGIICVASGVTILVFSGFPIVLAENATQLVLGLGCAGFVALPLIGTGVVLTHRAAAQSGPEGEAAASAAFLQKAIAVLNVLSKGHAHVGKADPHGTPMERLRAFELNSLTVAGWLLVVASAGFLLGEVLLFYRLIWRDPQGDLGPVGVLVLLCGLVLVIAFFCVGRLLLRAFGVPISIGSNLPPDRSHQFGQTAEPGAAAHRPRE
jgi:hypothetical protein